MGRDRIIMALSRLHWVKGYILGFVTKKDARESILVHLDYAIEILKKEFKEKEGSD